MDDLHENNSADQPVLYGPDGKPILYARPELDPNNKSSAISRDRGLLSRILSRSKSACGFLRKARKRIIKAQPKIRLVVGLVFSAIGLVAAAIAIYDFRPQFEANSISLISGSTHDVNISIKAKGYWTRDISVNCVTNKVTDGLDYAVEFHHYLSIEEYRVSSLDSAGGFSFTCPFGWTFISCPGLAYYIWEEPIPIGLNLGIPFEIQNRKLIPSYGKGLRPIDLSRDFQSCSEAKETSIDGTIFIRYRLANTPITMSSPIRVIGSNASGEWVWHQVPLSQPPIPDPPADGLKVLLGDDKHDSYYYPMTSGGHYWRDARVP